MAAAHELIKEMKRAEEHQVVLIKEADLGQIDAQKLERIARRAKGSARQLLWDRLAGNEHINIRLALCDNES